MSRKYFFELTALIIKRLSLQICVLLRGVLQLNIIDHNSISVCIARY